MPLLFLFIDRFVTIIPYLLKAQKDTFQFLLYGYTEHASDGLDFVLCGTELFATKRLLGFDIRSYANACSLRGRKMPST